jgi:hypothetical protein
MEMDTKAKVLDVLEAPLSISEIAAKTGIPVGVVGFTIGRLIIERRVRWAMFLESSTGKVDAFEKV